jgi:hypothetical protein
MKNKLKIGYLALAFTLTLASCSDAENESPALMAIPAGIDLETGVGFIGKGDVQLHYGWSNQQMQANADLLEFRIVEKNDSSYTWDCLNAKNEKLQSFGNTTSQTSRNNVVVVSRSNKNNIITGFRLDGIGSVAVLPNAGAGQPVGTCTGNSSFVEGSLALVSTSVNYRVEVKLNNGDPLSGWEILYE